MVKRNRTSFSRGKYGNFLAKEI